MPALGAVGLGQLLGGGLGGGRAGRHGAGRHQAQLCLGRRSARAAEAGAERAALRAGPAATAEPGDDLPPELPAARAVGGAAPRLPAVRAALLRPAARRRPAAQPQLAAPRRPAHLPAAPVLLRRGKVPRRRRLRARSAARGPQRGQRQQGQGQPHLSAPRVPPPVPRRRRGPAGDPPHAPRPAETRGCRGAAVPLLGTAAPLPARLIPSPSARAARDWPAGSSQHQACQTQLQTELLSSCLPSHRSPPAMALLTPPASQGTHGARRAATGAGKARRRLAAAGRVRGLSRAGGCPPCPLFPPPFRSPDAPPQPPPPGTRGAVRAPGSVRPLCSGFLALRRPGRGVPSFGGGSVGTSLGNGFACELSEFRARKELSLQEYQSGEFLDGCCH